jgi:type I restriction enzyme S subunit
LASASGGSTPSKAEPRYWNGGNVPWVSPKDMKVFLIGDSEDHITKAALERLSLVPKDSVLVVVRSGILSRTLPVAITTAPVTINQDMRAFVPAQDVSATFLAWQLIANERGILDACSKDGTTVSSIEGVALARYPIWIAPRAEQTRIVEKLEDLLGSLDAAVAELKAAQRKLAHYRQALLKAAVEGALTADWRNAPCPSSRRTPGSSTCPTEASKKLDPGVRRDDGNSKTDGHDGNGKADGHDGHDGHDGNSKTDGNDESGPQLLQRILQERRARWEDKQRAKFAQAGKPPPNGWQAKYPEPVAPDTSDLPALPEGWVWASVDQVGEVQLGRQRSPGKLTGIGSTPYIRAANITEEGIDLSDVLEMDFSDNERATFALKSGDVLLTEASGSPEHVGRPAIWRHEAPLCCFQNTVLRFTPQGIGSEFAYYSFLAMQKLGVFKRLSGGVGINHLSAGKFSKLAFALPPLEEQTQILTILETQLAAAKQQAAALTHALRQAAAQRRNLLKAAFAGQLVPQDPADEPASALLARIRASKADNAKPAASKRKAKGRA